MSALRTALFAALVLAAGCGGARTNVRADSAAFPISFSPGLRGPDGALLAAADKQEVGSFQLDYTAWSAVWTLVPVINNDRDISSEVNAQVAKAGGDGIIGMSVETVHCFWNFFTVIGLLPDCANISVRGSIVKVPSASPAPLKAAAPATGSKGST
jgi:hypothetical protein